MDQGIDITSDIVLIKLHGSLTWYMDKSDKLLRAEPFSLSAIKQLGALRTATLDTPLIYPSRRKLPIQAPFLENAARFQTLLRLPIHLVAIGCRFTDEHVRGWVADALARNPALSLTIVDPNAAEVAQHVLLANKTYALADQIRIAVGFFKDTLESKVGLEGALRHAKLVRHELSDAQVRESIRSTQVLKGGKDLFIRVVRPTEIKADDQVAGVTCTPDGRQLFYVAGKGVRKIYNFEIGTESARVVLSNASAARGLTYSDDDHCIYFVDNQLLQLRAITTAGLGRVRRLDLSTGRVSNVTKPKCRELIPLIRRAQREGWRAALRSGVANVLSWPTEILFDRKSRRLLVTQAREFSSVDVCTGDVRREAVPSLCFNLHALACIDADTVLGVEQGVAQAEGWGRVVVFKRETGGWTWSAPNQSEGHPRLFGIAYLPSAQLVLVAQCLAWPFGQLLVFRYPTFDLLGSVAGLDFPERVVVHHTWDFVLVVQKGRLTQIPTTYLDVVSG